MCQTRLEIDDITGKARECKEKLTLLLKHKGRDHLELDRRAQARRRIEYLQKRVNSSRELLEKEQLQIQMVEEKLKGKFALIQQAEAALRDKLEDVATGGIRPAQHGLQEELGMVVDELAAVRRTKVMQALRIFQVVVSQESGQIQSMSLPRYIHSLRGKGRLQECLAIALLARLIGDDE
jgi:hypothetical protein